MAIDRKRLIAKHDPVYTRIRTDAPLTVGNGTLGFTADVTGMQTLDALYRQADFPLLTMSDWGWHTAPAGKDGAGYTLDDVEMNHFDCAGRDVVYAVDPMPGNERVYAWLRENPHRYHLARIGFWYCGNEIAPEQITDIRQKLDLYTGILHSRFLLDGTPVTVQTCCHHRRDALGFSIQSDALRDGKLCVRIALPYPAADISGADWHHEERHQTQMESLDACCVRLHHTMDADGNTITICSDDVITCQPCGPHGYTVTAYADTLALGIGFAQADGNLRETFDTSRNESEAGWKRFWEDGGMLSFEGSRDKRAEELERRMILSLYLSAINSCNTMPPQETGLTVNSWFGKAHLEMTLWHLAYLPLWGRPQLLQKSLGWYRKILPKAVENAARNGYRGARWPKMVGPEGVDCPSVIATLLIWQQPHLLYLLELVYACHPDASFLEEYWPLVEATAEFMADYPVYNRERACYELVAPLIPAQERHKPMDTKNPAFELEYWRFGLMIAGQWAQRLGKEASARWKDVETHMAPPPEADGVYLAHENCPHTFTEFQEDHPSMIAIMGLLPGDRVKPEAICNTLQKIREVWNFQSMWGWDFAMMAMSYARLGDGASAVDILLYEAEKNFYSANGHNRQAARKDLPLYLPGNGSLLLALPLMAVGWQGGQAEFPGFPADGSWTVQAEGILPFPY